MTGPDRPAAGTGAEYEHTAVPPGARKSLLSVAGVWGGFPMCLGNAVFGGLIVYNLGLREGFWAILAGNLALLGYVGVLSHHAGRTGRSFAMQAADAFGPRGRLLVTGLLATVVIGWFSYQVGLTGTTLQQVLGWTPVWGALLGAVVYVALTVTGIRALSLVGLVAVPLFLLTAGLAFWYAARGGATASGALSYRGHDHGITFWSAVGIVVAGFADSGTMTADFTRWSRDGRSAVYATAAAFPFGNTVAYLVGGAVVATGGAAHPATDGGSFLGLLDGHGGWITALAVLFTLANLGSVAAHCLYNAAVGWSGLTPLRMRPLAVLLGAAGAALALTGVWTSIVSWLQLLGILVPPIGAVLIVHQFLGRRAENGEAAGSATTAPGAGTGADTAAGTGAVTGAVTAAGGPGLPAAQASGVPARRDHGLRWPATASWAAGSGAAWLLHHLEPGSLDALLGFCVAACAFGGHHLVTARVRPHAPGGPAAAAVAAGAARR
ncbi:cytosine permease [Streptomyces sp. NBC_00669]|uniref:cytosine permease n=1 Tax=Streptomyces sp. NBC_00669 TaxID=2976011 RepID=UPI002E379651|nr:cytosine permease [Streptomyces sp. NBC_00669]